MINNRFEVYKVKRELKRSGEDYTFLRLLPNKFGEPSGEEIEVGTIRALYHETSEHILISMNDTTQVRSKKVPSLLCLYSDLTPLNLVVGDRVVINGKTMKVTGSVDVQEWKLISDISLEVVDSGNV